MLIQSCYRSLQGHSTAHHIAASDRAAKITRYTCQKQPKETMLDGHMKTLLVLKVHILNDVLG